MCRDERVSVQEQFVDGNPDLVKALLKKTLGEGYRTVNPLAEPYCSRYGISDSMHRANGWFLWAQQGKRRWLLGIEIGKAPIGAKIDRGFGRWLTQFKPKTCNDWLLVPRLYGQILSFGEPDWEGIVSRQKSTLERRILSITRGLLAWEFQYRFLIWAGDENMSRAAVDRLVNGYRKQIPDALRQLENMHIGNRSLRIIFDDHPQYFLGTPDYYASGLLSQSASLNVGLEK